LASQMCPVTTEDALSETMDTHSKSVQTKLGGQWASTSQHIQTRHATVSPRRQHEAAKRRRWPVCSHSGRAHEAAAVLPHLQVYRRNDEYTVDLSAMRGIQCRFAHGTGKFASVRFLLEKPHRGSTSLAHAVYTHQQSIPSWRLDLARGYLPDWDARSAESAWISTVGS